MTALHMMILLPIFSVVLIALFARFVPRIHTGWAALIVPVILFSGFISYAPEIINGGTITASVPWSPGLDLYFDIHLDGLSLLFAFLITGVGILVFFYSIFYLSKERESLGHFYSYLLMFMGAMLGIVLTDHLMVLYLFWELTSISSFLLISFWYRRRKSQYGAQKSFLITVFGGVAMLVGFIMLYVMSGTYSIQEIIAMRSSLVEHDLFIAALILVLLGAFTKSAQFPFHIWLPDAMEAPTPVSAYLHSATMVKAGLFLVARFTPLFGGEAVWFWLVTGVGLFTMFWGAFTAVRHNDLKALLAYSTISQLGLIMSLLGIGSAALYIGDGVDSMLYTTAIFVALFHLFNHSTFKGALFMVVGIVDHKVGTRDIRKLGGLIAFMPVTFTLALISSFSMAGLPPFNGFLSKEMFFTATLNANEMTFFSMETWGLLFPIVAVVGSIFTFTYSAIIVFRTFFGKYRPERLEKTPREASIGLLLPPAILCTLVVGIFFFPNVLSEYILTPAMNAVLPSFAGVEGLIPEVYAWHGFNTELLMTAIVVGMGLLLVKATPLWREVYSFFPPRLSLDAAYQRALAGTEIRSRQITDSYMTGFLRHYLYYIYGFLILTVGGALIWSDSISVNIADDAPAGTYEIILTVIMAVSAVSILFVNSRKTATLLNGVLGYCIAIFFVLFRAPDLALTQLVVETVTTVLFLLCFYYLPDWKPEDRNLKVKIPKVIISISMGALTVLIALAVQNQKMFETISTYYEDAYELAGGRNIVNAILGDFRALDTMLEVVVLFIAGIGVYTMIKLKGKEADKTDERK
ncbi:Na+/H+ antiporter subunit A [Jeotgalibacillus malaysiensis]|uniref:Na+/H+ antiporter subunit A n=1 Tax=Jeotgalibacillus malaysiensis TaxID=1508404 RepID=UPI00384C7125